MGTRARSAATVLVDAEASRAHRLPNRVTPFPTGYEPFDAVLSGGLRAQDLVLVGGRPGIGKTVALLQWARQVAIAGRHAVYVCYEHSEDTLLTRLLSLELGELARPEDVPTLDKLRMLVREVALGRATCGASSRSSRSSPTPTSVSAATPTGSTSCVPPARPTSLCSRAWLASTRRRGRCS